MSEYEAVINTRDVGPGELLEVQVRGHAIGLTNVGQTYYAFEARCPIDGTNLAQRGRIEGDVLKCPSDSSAYDVTTGDCVEPEGCPGLTRYAIRVEDNQVKIGPRLVS